MPLTDKGDKIMSRMKDEYGSKKGERVFYASKNKGNITGVDADDDMSDAARRMVSQHSSHMMVMEALEKLFPDSTEDQRERAYGEGMRKHSRSDAEYLSKEKAWLNVTRSVYDSMTVGKKYTLPDGRRFELLEKNEGGRHSAGMPQIYVLWLGSKERRPVPGQSRGDAEIIEDCDEIKTDAELDCDTRDDDHSKDGIAQLIAAHYAPILERAGYKALAQKARYGKLADVVAVGREVSALQYNKAAPYNDNLHAAINAMTGIRGASLAELRGVAQGHGIRVDSVMDQWRVDFKCESESYFTVVRAASKDGAEKAAIRELENARKNGDKTFKKDWKVQSVGNVSRSDVADLKATESMARYVLASPGALRDVEAWAKRNGYDDQESKKLADIVKKLIDSGAKHLGDERSDADITPWDIGYDDFQRGRVSRRYMNNAELQRDYHAGWMAAKLDKEREMKNRNDAAEKRVTRAQFEKMAREGELEAEFEPTRAGMVQVRLANGKRQMWEITDWQRSGLDAVREDASKPMSNAEMQKKYGDWEFLRYEEQSDGTTKAQVRQRGGPTKEIHYRDDAIERFDSNDARLSAVERLSAAINVVGQKVARLDATVATDSGVGAGMQMSPAEMDATLQSYFDRRKFSYAATDAVDLKGLNNSAMEQALARNGIKAQVTSVAFSKMADDGSAIYRIDMKDASGKRSKTVEVFIDSGNQAQAYLR